MPLAWREPNRASTRAACRQVEGPQHLSNLVGWAGDLHRAGRNCAEIAAILNQEAWRPPKRRDTFNGPMVRRLLASAGLIEARRKETRVIPQRRPDEWTIGELAELIDAPQSTIYNWVQKGRLSSRSIKLGGVNAKLVTADAAAVAELKAARATPLPWRLPPPRSHPIPSILES